MADERAAGEEGWRREGRPRDGRRTTKERVLLRLRVEKAGWKKMGVEGRRTLERTTFERTQKGKGKGKRPRHAERELERRGVESRKDVERKRCEG